MISIKPSHQGLLHEHLGIAEGQKLTIGDLMRAKKRAKKSGNGTLMKEATFAANARSWNK